MLPWDKNQNPNATALRGRAITPLTAPSLRVQPLPAPSAPNPAPLATALATQPPAATAPPAQDRITASAASDVQVLPPQTTPENSDQLAMWGYRPLGFNALEQEAVDFINNIYGSGGGLETMTPAGDFYNKVLAGDFGPEGQTYLQAVLDPMRQSMMADYDEMSKNLANRFSQFGGYYGGRSGIAQAKLADLTARSMAEKEAGLRYQRFADDISNRASAAQGLQGLGAAQTGVAGDMLNFLLSGGNMITQREAMNTAEYQNALQRAYNDWLRARQESLLPFSWGQALLGTQAVQPIVTQSQSPWGAVLGGLGTALGGFGLSKLP